MYWRKQLILLTSLFEMAVGSFEMCLGLIENGSDQLK